MTKILSKKLKEDENLAYILGVIKGDGCIDIKSGAVRLNVTDKDFALTFKKVLEKWTGFKVGFYTYPEQTAPYQTVLSSRYISNFLKKVDFNKIKKFVNTSKKIKALFLRGMYDSEGCVNFKSRQIFLSNQDGQLLQLCKDSLLDLGVESNPIRICQKKGSIFNFPTQKNYAAKRNCYEFDIGRKKSLIKFKDLVGFNIKRKQDKLGEIINSYKYEMTNVRDFTVAEIKEINQYIITNVPFSVLERFFLLTENIDNKTDVFVAIYRIINSAKNYVKEDNTKNKLINMLNECKGEYRDLYSSLIHYQEGGFGSYNHHRIIISIMEDISKRTKIDNLIDAFLLFAEKQVFFSIDKIAGIESSRKGGEDVVDKILGEKKRE